MYCCALRRDGHPCRGYGQPTEYSSHPLCHRHRNFFREDRPVNLLFGLASIFQTQPERQWILRVLQAPHFQWTAAHTHRLTALSISEDWYERDCAAYVYDLVIRAGIMNPYSNFPELWERQVKRNMRTVAVCTREPLPTYYHQIIRDLLGPYFQNANPIFTLGRLLTMRIPIPLNNANVDISGMMWRDTLTTLMEFIPTRPLIGYPLNEFFQRLADKAGRMTHITPFPAIRPALWRDEGLREFTHQLLKQAQATARQQFKQRIGPLKEELVAHVFHPDRVMAALAAGRDVEDL